MARNPGLIWSTGRPMIACPVLSALWIAALARRALCPDLIASAFRLLDRERGVN